VQTGSLFIRKVERRCASQVCRFTQPIIDNVTEAVTGSPPADLAVILAGPDLDTLRKYAGETLVLLKQVPGAADTSRFIRNGCSEYPTIARL
jgi:heavy metal efflux system protein